VHRLVLAALVVVSVLCLIALGVVESLLAPFWILLTHLLRAFHQ
jgi:hypothetical protein